MWKLGVGNISFSAEFPPPYPRPPRVWGESPLDHTPSDWQARCKVSILLKMRYISFPVSNPLLCSGSFTHRHDAVVNIPIILHVS